MRDAFYGNVERVVPIVIRPVLERDREVVLGFTEVARVDVVGRQFLVVASASVRLDHNEVAKEAEQLPQG